MTCRRKLTLTIQIDFKKKTSVFRTCRALHKYYAFGILSYTCFVSCSRERKLKTRFPTLPAVFFFLHSFSFSLAPCDIAGNLVLTAGLKT